MIVSCPSCSARYRIDKSKIKGRGAKITCPRCSHKFVVYKDQDNVPPPAARRTGAATAIMHRDFRKVGVTWRVRSSGGTTKSLHELAELRTMLENGDITTQDSLSYDARTWAPIDSIDELETYFEDIWKRAERGEIRPPADAHGADPDEEEDDEDAPTTIMSHGSSLMDDIRKAVQEAATPDPAPPRSGPPALLDEDDPQADEQAPQRQLTPRPSSRFRPGVPGSAEVTDERPAYLSAPPDPLTFQQEVVGIHATILVDNNPKAEPAQSNDDEGDNSVFTLALIVLVVVLVGVAALLVSDAQFLGLGGPSVSPLAPGPESAIFAAPSDPEPAPVADPQPTAEPPPPPTDAPSAEEPTAAPVEDGEGTPG